MPPPHTQIPPSFPYFVEAVNEIFLKHFGKSHLINAKPHKFMLWPEHGLGLYGYPVGCGLEQQKPQDYATSATGETLFSSSPFPSLPIFIILFPSCPLRPSFLMSFPPFCLGLLTRGPQYNPGKFLKFNYTRSCIQVNHMHKETSCRTSQDRRPYVNRIKSKHINAFADVSEKTVKRKTQLKMLSRHCIKLVSLYVMLHIMGSIQSKIYAFLI